MSTYAEPMVARVLNVNRETVAAARKAALVKGTDWTLENSVVHYAAPGLKKLLVALGVSDADLARFDPATAARDPVATVPAGVPEPKKIAPSVAGQIARASAAAAARPLVALVVESLSRNPLIVHAVPADGGPVVLVRVRTNENFLPGMTLNARAPAPGSTLYFFEGHCPRWKGRY